MAPAQAFALGLSPKTGACDGVLGRMFEDTRCCVSGAEGVDDGQPFDALAILQILGVQT